MSSECWIPAGRWPVLAPLMEEWERRAALLADARARRDALVGDAAIREDRERREALAAAYATGDPEAAAELPAPLTEREREDAYTDASEHVRAAMSALSEFEREAVAAIREHVPEFRAEIDGKQAEATAKLNEIEGQLRALELRRTMARRSVSRLGGEARWLDRVEADDTFTGRIDPPAPSPAQRPATLVEIANQGVRPALAPEGLEVIDEDTPAEQTFEVAKRNGAATKARIEALNRAEQAEQEARRARAAAVMNSHPRVTQEA